MLPVHGSAFGADRLSKKSNDLAKKRKNIRWRLLHLVLGCAGLIVLSIAFYLIFPDVSDLKKHNPVKTSFMEYRENEWKAAGKNQHMRQNWKPLSAISSYVIKGVIIAEDDKFWSHDGFDFEAMQKAMERNIKKGRFKYGGSTISQQLAKNLYLTPSRNPIRKLKEAILTWRIEQTLSKRRILELYLNVAEWGDGIFGIEAAARRYYGKPAAALDAHEAARLVSALPNPIRYVPNRTSRYLDGRSERIYQIMVRRGIVIEDFESIMKEPEIALPPAEPPTTTKPAPDSASEAKEAPQPEENQDFSTRP